MMCTGQQWLVMLVVIVMGAGLVGWLFMRLVPVHVAQPDPEPEASSNGRTYFRDSRGRFASPEGNETHVRVMQAIDIPLPPTMLSHEVPEYPDRKEEE
jgi:hypothetical protein